MACLLTIKVLLTRGGWNCFERRQFFFCWNNMQVKNSQLCEFLNEFCKNLPFIEASDKALLNTRVQTLSEFWRKVTRRPKWASSANFASETHFALSPRAGRVCLQKVKKLEGICTRVLLNSIFSKKQNLFFRIPMTLLKVFKQI